MNFKLKAAILVGCLLFIGIMVQAQVKNIHACFNQGNCHFSAKNNSKKKLEVQYRLWRLESSTTTNETESPVLLGVVERNGNVQTGEVVYGIIYQDNVLFSVINDEDFAQGIIYQDNVLFSIIYQDNVLFDVFEEDDITYFPVQEGVVNMPKKKRKRINLDENLPAGTYVLVIDILGSANNENGKMNENWENDNAIQALKIYPNPVTDVTTITLPNDGNQVFELSLTDLNGTLVYQQQISGTQHRLETTDFEKGIYMLRLQGQESVYQQKLLLID